jgi:SAM-dependent methyltransferase
MRTLMSYALPDYAKRLDALHSALADDFRGIVRMLPIAASDTVLDAGCGDGFFAALLNERLPRGLVIALDSSPAFLVAAQNRLEHEIAVGRRQVAEGDVIALPFETASLDAVWSAHSMQSYESIPRVLTEFRRVLKPGGILAVLESDDMHSIMLPWPSQLELEIRQAERCRLKDADDRIGAYFPRYASQLLRAAGFHGVERRHVLVHRPGPLEGPLRSYVQMYLDDLVDHTHGYLSDSSRRHFEEWASACGPGSEDCYFTSLQVLTIARTLGV